MDRHFLRRFFFKTDESMAELANFKIYITNSMKFSFKSYTTNSILKPLYTPSTTEVRTKLFMTKICNILHKTCELNWIQILQITYSWFKRLKRLIWILTIWNMPSKRYCWPRPCRNSANFTESIHILHSSPYCYEYILMHRLRLEQHSVFRL